MLSYTTSVKVVALTLFVFRLFRSNSTHVTNIAISQYVGVLYADGTTVTYNFGQCYPYEIGSVLAEVAVFCKGVTCENNPYVVYSSQVVYHIY